MSGEFIDSTSIKVKWFVVEKLKRKGPIKGYKIFCYSKDGIFVKEESVDDTKFTVDITNLEIYTFYQFKVLAFTTVCGGPKSNAIHIRTDSESMLCLLIILKPYPVNSVLCFSVIYEMHYRV